MARDTIGTTGRRQRATLVDGWSWKHIDIELVTIEAHNLHITEHLGTPEQLESAVDHLTTQLVQLELGG